MATYDYIVIGAGSAGCVVASRLSEDPNISVLLIEAGGVNRGEHLEIPAMFGQAFKSDNDWDFQTEPEPHLNGRMTPLTRGRGLGGTSAINGMIYARGNRRDFDEWRDLGLAGWGWDEVLPYFARSESNTRGASSFHGADGELTVSDLRFKHQITKDWVEAAVSAGYCENDDFNGVSQDGVGWYQVTQREGERWSTARAFLDSVFKRGNLTILTHTMVCRVVIEEGRATGVEVEHLGERRVITVAREIVVSAGVYQTPKILMLSGIGHATYLKSFGIEPVADLPVGDNLQDHPGAFLIYGTGSHTMLSDFTQENIELWRQERQGPLTSNVVEAGGFFRTRDDLEVPDVQSMVMPVGFLEGGIGEVTDDQYVIMQALLRPTSRGTVRLRSPRPDSKPRVLHNHLASDDDVRAMVEGLKINMRIADQPQISRHRTSVVSGPASSSDADLERYLRSSVAGVYHGASSASMGHVLDERLCVYGIEGLRVADASAMPLVVRGNTNAATIMIGEKAAALILE